MIKVIKKINRFYHTKRGKTIFFFGFYFFFFLFLIIYLPSSPNENNKNSNNKIYDFSKLEQNKFDYQITIQNNDSIKVVDKINDVNNSNNFNNSYNESENNAYNEFLSLTNIKQIIKNSKFISKVPKDNIYQVTYEIQNNDLCKLYSTDLCNELINYLVIITDKESNVLSISLDLSNYMHLNDAKINIYKVLINYEY